MSSKTTLTDFVGDQIKTKTEPEPERPDLDEYDDEVLKKWNPGGHPRRCRNCDRHVTAEFRRAASDDNGVVHRCPECATGVEITGGAAAGVDVREARQGDLSIGGDI